MKKLITTLGILLITIGYVLSNDTLIEYIKNIIPSEDKIITLGEKNQYYRNYDFNFVQNTDNFSPSCYQDILNIYYTAINAGKEEFTFYCPKDYISCIDDIKQLANDQDTLSNINNFVHPYNGFSHIETSYDSTGKITINIYKSYTNDDIEKIEEKLDYIENNIIDKNDNLNNNIKKVHDYIINNSKYDTMRNEKNVIMYKSDIAYGPLIQGYGICGGYTDAMELMFERLGVMSYKISGNKHIWNSVYLNNNWYHLDLTWDDPVTNDNTDVLDYSFYLISTNKLLNIESDEHNFNQEIYSELKEGY